MQKEASINEQMNNYILSPYNFNPVFLMLILITSNTCIYHVSMKASAMLIEVSRFLKEAQKPQAANQ